MIQIKAKQQNVSFEKNVEKLAFVLSAHLYNTLASEKVIEEASKRSGMSVGVYPHNANVRFELKTATAVCKIYPNLSLLMFLTF